MRLVAATVRAVLLVQRDLEVETELLVWRYPEPRSLTCSGSDSPRE